MDQDYFEENQKLRQHITKLQRQLQAYQKLNNQIQKDYLQLYFDYSDLQTSHVKLFDARFFSENKDQWKSFLLSHTGYINSTFFDLFPEMYSLQFEERDLAEITKYENGEQISKTFYVDVVDEYKYPVKFMLDLEALSDIYANDYGQSVLCKIVSNEQYAKVASAEDLIFAENMPKQLEAKKFLRKETFFLKLPIKDEKYKFVSIPEIDPTNLDKSFIKKGAVFSIDCFPGIWMNLKDGTCGMFLKLVKISKSPILHQPKKKVVKIASK